MRGRRRVPKIGVWSRTSDLDLPAARPGPLHMCLAVAIRAAARDGQLPVDAALNSQSGACPDRADVRLSSRVGVCSMSEPSLCWPAVRRLRGRLHAGSSDRDCAQAELFRQGGCLPVPTFCPLAHHLVQGYECRQVLGGGQAAGAWQHRGICGPAS